MSNSAIFHGAPSLLRTWAPSAIAKSTPRVLRTGSTSAIYSASGDLAPAVISAFGSTSSTPYIEDYASATTPLGPTSSNTYINFIQNQFFGPTSSDEYQIIADRGNVLRGAQFSTNTVALDRFATPLAAVLAVFEDLDLTAAAASTVYTVPTGKIALIFGCLVRIKSSDTVTGDASASLGINPSTTDLFAEESMVAVQDVSDVWSFWKDTSGGLVANSGDDVDLDVTVAATATTLTCDVFVIGLLI